jgi:hypothetical protein
VPPEISDRGRVALTHFHQPSGCQPLESLADRGARDTENFCEPALAGQRLTRLHFTAEYLGNDLFEDVLGYGSPIDRV